VNYRIGVDIGGTFTDFTVVADDGRVLLWKEDTTADNPVRAIEAGLAAIAEQVGLDVAGLLGSTELFVHGTTVATNMLIQRNGPRVGVLCTEGFRDVLYFRDGYKPDRFNIHLPQPGTLVDRWLRVGVAERYDPRGNELVPLDEDAVRAAAAGFREAGVEAVAVAFLWSMLYPDHELRAAEIVAEEMPGAHVVCSHTILPEIREWERTSSAMLSAYIAPRIVEYLTNLERTLLDGGLDRPPLIMQINGGCARVADIIRRPVNILASGPAAAPAAALHHREAIGDDLVTVDMGGTSLDVCLIRGGRAAMSRFVQVEGQPIGVPAVDVHSVGAGGGSIAWIDEGTALRVGPRSAGARPGPACYDYGGTEPTVSDANVVLGYLDPDAFLGGRRRLRDDLSVEAIRTHVAEPLGLTPVDAAAGIVRVVNANMVAAIRAVSVERGIDPRHFTLVCGGGAGGLHAADLARELGMSRVFVPNEAGVLCSFGMTVTDVRHDHVAAFHTMSDTVDLAELNRVIADLEATAVAELREEGFPAELIRLERLVDARYPGQHNEITIPAAAGVELGAEHLRELETAFNDEHRAQFTYDRAGLPIEMLHWRVVAVGRNAIPSAPAEQGDGRTPVPFRTGPAYFAGDAATETAFYDVSGLDIGAELRGPAVVSAPTTTIVVHPGDVLTRPSAEGFVIQIAAKEPVDGDSLAAVTA
jgi:N-methylhydantoinase A